MGIFSNRVAARLFAALSLFWVAFYSKYHSLGDPGDPVELITFFCPFLIAHWFLKQTSFLEKSPPSVVFPALPIFVVAATMIVSSIYHGQSIIHAQGPSIWLWATAFALLIRHWQFEFIVRVCTLTLVGYVFYFIAVQHPEVQNPASGTPRYLYENPNILSFYITALFLLSSFCTQFRKSSIPAAAFVFIVLYYNGSNFGLISFLAGLVVLAGYERYIFPALVLLGGIGVFVKQVWIGDFDAVEVRLQMLAEGMRQGMESLAFGAGHGRKMYIELRPGFRLDHPHNFIVQGFRVAGAIGVLGLLALLAWLLTAWKNLLLQQRALLVFFLFWSLADDWFMWHGTILFFVLGCTPFAALEESSEETNQ